MQLGDDKHKPLWTVDLHFTGSVTDARSEQETESAKYRGFKGSIGYPYP